jgi:hypothetical protein
LHDGHKAACAATKHEDANCCGCVQDCENLDDSKRARRPSVRRCAEVNNGRTRATEVGTAARTFVTLSTTATLSARLQQPPVCCTPHACLSSVLISPPNPAALWMEQDECSSRVPARDEGKGNDLGCEVPHETAYTTNDSPRIMSARGQCSARSCRSAITHR